VLSDTVGRRLIEHAEAIIDVGAITLQPFAFGTFDIRYNVVSVPGILGSPALTLTVRYLASNTSQRVVVSFKQYSLLTGTTTVLSTLDSNSFPASTNFQVQAVCVPVALDFVNNSYYITFARHSGP
jgi:hypothetical protein